jgi:hypothetical protein
VGSYTAQLAIQISTSIIHSNAKLYSSKTHDKTEIWLVWQDTTGLNITGQRFDQNGARQGLEIVLLAHATAVLQLYGASGQANASDVHLDITYKKTEAGVEKTFIASFTQNGQ